MKKLEEAYREALETLGWEHDGPEDVGVFTMASGKMLEAWATSKNCKKPGWAPFGLFARWLSTEDGRLLRDTVAKAAIVRASYYCNDGVELESLREYLGRFACLAVFFLLERRVGEVAVDWARELLAAQVGCEADSLLDLVMRTPVVVGPFEKEEAAKMMEKMEANGRTTGPRLSEYPPALLEAASTVGHIPANANEEDLKAFLDAAKRPGGGGAE